MLPGLSGFGLGLPDGSMTNGNNLFSAFEHPIHPARRRFQKLPNYFEAGEAKAEQIWQRQSIFFNSTRHSSIEYPDISPNVGYPHTYSHISGNIPHTCSHCTYFSVDHHDFGHFVNEISSMFRKYIFITENDSEIRLALK